MHETRTVPTYIKVTENGIANTGLPYHFLCSILL